MRFGFPEDEPRQASTQAVSLVPMQGSAMTKAICHLPPQQNPRYASRKEDSSGGEIYSMRMASTIEKISAVTLRVANMTESVRFYRDVLGIELLYGGEDAGLLPSC